MKKKIKNKRIAPMYKIINRKRVSICDYEGKCTNKAYREVYPFLMGGKHANKGWSYLCKKHFEQEKKKYKGKLPCCTLDK